MSITGILGAQAGLERLAFQNVGCSIAACRAIGELLTHAGALATLHLHNNMSDDEGAAAIAGVQEHGLACVQAMWLLCRLLSALHV